MGAVLLNPATGLSEYVEDVPGALAQGYTAPGGVQVGAEGSDLARRVDPRQLAGAAAGGAVPVNLSRIGTQADVARERARFDTLGQEVLSFGEGALSGGTLGLSDLLTDSYESRMRAEVNPVASGAGVVAGVIVPSLLSGGSGSAGAVARMFPTAMSARAAEAIGAAVVKGLAEKAAGRLTTALVKGTQLAVEGGVDGAIWGAAQTSTDAILGRRPFAGEAILSQALFGAGLGGVLGAAGGALKPSLGVLDTAGKATGKLVTEATAVERTAAIKELAGRVSASRDFLASARKDVEALATPELSKLVDQAEAAQADFLAAMGAKTVEKAEARLVKLMTRASPEEALILSGKLDDYQRQLKQVDDALDLYRPNELDKLREASYAADPGPAVNPFQERLAPVPNMQPVRMGSGAPDLPVRMGPGKKHELGIFPKNMGEGELQIAPLGAVAERYPNAVRPMQPGFTVNHYGDAIGERWWDANPNWKREIERVQAGGELLPARVPMTKDELKLLREKAKGEAIGAEAKTGGARGAKKPPQNKVATEVIPSRQDTVDLTGPLAAKPAASGSSKASEPAPKYLDSDKLQGGLGKVRSAKPDHLPPAAHREDFANMAFRKDPVRARTPRMTHDQLGAGPPSSLGSLDLAGMGKVLGSDLPQQGPAADLFMKGWASSRLAKAAGRAEKGPGLFGEVARGVATGAAYSKLGWIGGGLVARALSMGAGRLASAAGEAMGKIRAGAASLLKPGTTRLVTRSAIALRGATMKDLDLGLARPEDPKDDYGATIAQLVRATESPSLLRDAVEDKFLGVQVVAPDVAEVAIDRASGLVRGILAKAPKPPASLVQPERWRPDRTKQAAFLRYTSGALYPLEVMSRPGDASHEALEGVRDFWPEIYTAGQEELLRNAESFPQLGHQAARRVSLILGVPLTQLSDPAYVQRQQESYAMEAEKAKQPPPNGPMGSQGGGITINLPGTTPTPAQAYSAAPQR